MMLLLQHSPPSSDKITGTFYYVIHTPPLFSVEDDRLCVCIRVCMYVHACVGFVEWSGRVGDEVFQEGS